MKQIHARAVQTIEKGVQIDLSTIACKRYLRRNANTKTSAAVLYVDIDGSTRLTLSLPSDRLALALQLFSQEMSMVVANFGGYVLKYVGDAVIALNYESLKQDLVRGFLAQFDGTVFEASLVYAIRA